MIVFVCEICGNEREAGTGICPWCGEGCAASAPRVVVTLHRLVNLEKGFPTVEQALKRLSVELESARLQGYLVLTLVHGYGSSGKGGRIKKAVRQQLDYDCQCGIVNTVVNGEDFSRRSGAGKQLLHRFPFLTTHRDLNRHNQGITIVVLKR
jgi:hypothetical protein